MLKLPNKNEYRSPGRTLYFYRDLIPFFDQPCNIGKNADSAGWSGRVSLSDLFLFGDNRRLAFFGALTSVGALFCLHREIFSF